MPRPHRIVYENAFYHVMNRGRGRQIIFHNAAYYQAFLDTLQESVSRFDAVIHAYCLLGNHYHLLIETPDANLSRIMRHINGVYTQRYNRLKQTDGPLFRGRYKALLVDEDAYLLQLSRYIHRNPVEMRTRLVDKLEDYPWSSYPSYINRAAIPRWLHRKLTYQMLGQRNRYAGYKAYVEVGNDTEIEQFYGKGNLPSVLGGQGFREAVYRTYGNKDSAVLREAVMQRPDMKTIVSVVADVFGILPDQIMRRAKGRPMRNDARKVAMYACQRIGNVPLKMITGVFGLGHEGSVSRLFHDVKVALERGEFVKQMKVIEKRLYIIQ